MREYVFQYRNKDTNQDWENYYLCETWHTVENLTRDLKTDEFELEDHTDTEYRILTIETLEHPAFYVTVENAQIVLEEIQ